MTLPWVPILASCFLLLNGVSAKLPFEDWQCGSEETSRKYAYDTIYDKCPTLGAKLNHCCVVHDECYVRQMGQDKCDADFCECNNAIINSTAEGQDCKVFTDTVCAVMPFMGFFAYDSSSNYSEPVDLIKRLPDADELYQPFQDMYGACSKVNSTTSSCALIWNNCNEDDIVPCAEQVCTCVQDAYRLDNVFGCKLAVDKICAVARIVENSFSFSAWLTNPYVICLSLLFMTVIVSLFICLKRRENDDPKLINYSSVSEA